MRYTTLPMAATLMFALAAPAFAREELVTLPARDKVGLTIYNSVDLTLVSERRSLAFAAGSNKLSFSWAGTLIDPSSVVFRCVDKPDKVEVLDTSFPGETNKMLVWNIDAAEAGDYKVEISYFTSGISWASSYTGVLNDAGNSMDLTGYISVTNNSGEEYENANVAVVIGTINLVENVAELATRDGKQRAYREMRKAAESARAPGADADWAGNDASKAEAPKDFIKEGASEYYIYTIPGTETIQNGWSKRLQSLPAASKAKSIAVPVDSVWTYRPDKYGAGFRRIYTFKNDKDHKLGDEPLPGGNVTIYQNKGQGLAYVAALSVQYIPKGDEVKIAGEPDPNVTLEVKRMGYKKIDMQFENWGNSRRVTGWTDVEEFEVIVKYPAGVPLKAEVFLQFYGDFDTKPRDGTTLEQFDHYTRKLVVNGAAAQVDRGEAKFGYTLTRRQGKNAK